MLGTQILFDRDTEEGVEYVGISASGTAIDSPFWQIKKIVKENDLPISVKYAGGRTEQQFKWTDRATLAYS